MLELKIVTTVLLGLKIFTGWLSMLIESYNKDDIVPRLGLVYALAIVTIWVTWYVQKKILYVLWEWFSFPRGRKDM